MKPGRNDRKHQILITGVELDELQRHTWMMAESFGLDRRIARYQGKRPLGLYRWDLDCLIDVMASALADPKAYPSHTSPGYLALQALYERVKQEYDEAYK